jgi:hypothetical protein
MQTPRSFTVCAVGRCVPHSKASYFVLILLDSDAGAKDCCVVALHDRMTVKHCLAVHA